MPDSPTDIQGGVVFDRQTGSGGSGTSGATPNRTLLQVKKLDFSIKIPFSQILAELEKVYDPHGETKWQARTRVRLPIIGHPDAVELAIFDPNHPDYSNQDGTLYPSDYLRFLLQMVKRGYAKGFRDQLRRFVLDGDNLYFVRQYLTEAGNESVSGINELALPNRQIESSLVVDIIELFSSLHAVAELIDKTPDEGEAVAQPGASEGAAPIGSLSAPAVTTGLAGAGGTAAATETTSGEPVTTPEPAPLTNDGMIANRASNIADFVIRDLFGQYNFDQQYYQALEIQVRLQAQELVRNLSPGDIAGLATNHALQAQLVKDLKARLRRNTAFQLSYQEIIRSQYNQVIDHFGQKLSKSLEIDSLDAINLRNLTDRLDTMVLSSGQEAIEIFGIVFTQMTDKELALMLFPGAVINDQLLDAINRNKDKLQAMLETYIVARNSKLAGLIDPTAVRNKGLLEETTQEAINDPANVVKHIGTLLSPAALVTSYGVEAVAEGAENSEKTSTKKKNLILLDYYQKFLPIWHNLDFEVQKQAVLLAYHGDEGMYKSYVGSVANITNEGKLDLNPLLFKLGMPWNEIVRLAVKKYRQLSDGEDRELAKLAKNEAQLRELVSASQMRANFWLELKSNLPADQMRAISALLFVKDLTRLQQILSDPDEQKKVAALQKFYQYLAQAEKITASIENQGVKNHFESRLKELGEVADQAASQLLPAEFQAASGSDITRVEIVEYVQTITVIEEITLEIEEPLFMQLNEEGDYGYDGANQNDMAEAADEVGGIQDANQSKGVRGKVGGALKRSKPYKKGKDAIKQKALAQMAKSKLGKKAAEMLAKKGLGAAVGAASGPAGWALTAAMLAKDAAKFLRDPKNRKKIGFIIGGLGGGLALLISQLLNMLARAAWITGGLIGAGIGFAIGGPLGAVIVGGIGAGLGYLAGHSAFGGGLLGGSGTAAPSALSGTGAGITGTSALSPTAAGGAGVVASGTAAGVGAGTGAAVATGGGLLAMGTATLIPMFTILGMMGITIYTVFVIMASFLAPLPVGDPTARNGRSSEYVTLTKTAEPNKLANGQTGEITYTVSIKPKPGYKVVLTDVSDIANDGKFQILSNNPANSRNPTFSPIGTLISLSNFPPEAFGTSVSYVYKVTMAGGADVLVRNNLEITYNVLDRAGQTVQTSQKLSTAASVIIGDPKVSCWPTSGTITQLPNGSWSHAGENAYDIAASLGSRVFAPVSGTAYRKESRSGLAYTGYGLYVEMEFMLANNFGGRLIFGHLSSVPANITSSGTAVNAGDLIGRVGSTGNSTGSHLHYELRSWPGHLPLTDFFPALISEKPMQGAKVYTCF